MLTLLPDIQLRSQSFFDGLDEVDGNEKVKTTLGDHWDSPMSVTLNEKEYELKKM